jgi:hypothetical protein
MRNLPSLVVSAVSTWDGKALAKGQKQLGGFDKTIKNVARTLGVTFGATAMLAYGKNAVKAFSENEKSAKRLEMVLKNLGLAFDTQTIEKNLDSISAKFGYEGEVLREAFQKLITATGSTTKSQDLLNLSLDVAAGSGEDLLTVNQDLAALYVGNTKGLRKYNLGLSQSELKTLDFNDAVQLLTKTFAGAGTAELETYAGKMRVLKEAADNAQESIGTGLVTAFEILAGSNGIEGATDAITRFGETSRDVLIGTASYVDKLVDKLSKLNGKGGGFDWVALIPILGGYFGKGGVVDVLAAEGRAATGRDKQYGGVYADQYNAQKEAAAAKARAKAEAAAAKRQKELLALQKKSALAEKNKLSLSKAAAVFDTNRISIAAALKATYDKETILRLEALQAIEEDNGDLALRKIGELAAFQKNADLEKLAGIKQIGEATLNELNTRLLTELDVINKSKMAEGDKELAREEAFKKYNAAIEAAGQLAAKEQYSERTQIQLTEIARLASQSNTTNALKTQVLLREQAELSMIDRVAAAQKKADEARLSALQTYINLLNKAGTGPSANTATIEKMSPAQAEAALAKEPTSVPTALTPAQISGLRYAAQGQDAYEKSLAKISLTDQVAQGSFTQGREAGLSVAAAASGARYAAQAAASYTLNFSAGVIAQPDEFAVLIQDTIQKLNRGGDPLTTAGVL